MMQQESNTSCDVVKKPLTLDEAIAHAEEVAGNLDTACKREHKQLADWLMELKSRRSAEYGDVAKLRKALESCLDFIMRLDRAFNPFMQNLLEDAIAKAQAALATTFNPTHTGWQAMKEQETHADIIAEMRGARTEFPFVYLIGEPDTPEVIDSKTKKIIEPRKINIRRMTVKELANRLETAHKCECGDCAKLREALAKIRSEAYECDQGGEYLGEGPDPGFDRIIKMCDAALATISNQNTQEEN